MHGEFVGLCRHRHIVIERHELERDARILGILDQRLAALGLFDLARALQQRFEIAIGVDQFGRRLDADAAHARHIVGGVAGQRLHLDHLGRRHAEFLHHLGRADALVLHRVEQFDLAVDHQLHQVLVGRDDGALARRPRAPSAHRWRSDRRPR